MRLTRVLKADLSAGLRECWKRVLVVALLACALIPFWLMETKARGYSDADIPHTLASTLCTNFGGMKVFHPGEGERFRMPAAWLLSSLAIFYCTVTYPYRDLMGFGRNVLISSQSRWTWWLSKCLWVSAVMLACTLAVLVMDVLATLFMDGTLSLGIDQVAAATHSFLTDQNASQDLTPFFLALPCMYVALGLMQLALSLVLRPTLSFGTTALILIISAYYTSPWLPGNYLMAARSSSVINEGVSPLVGLGLAVFIATAAVVLGGIRLARMDYIDKEFSQ